VVSVNVPGAGGPFTLFTLTATPVGGGAALSVSCSLPADCVIAGLKAGVTYDVSVVATSAGGVATPPSASVLLAVPDTAIPVSYGIAVTVTGPTSISANVSPSMSGGAGPYIVTATPIGGGTSLVVTCAVPYDCTLSGLTPGTTYDVTATATGSSGQPTPPSATQTVTTPLARCVMNGAASRTEG